MAKRTTRRTFFKRAGVTAGLLALGGCAPRRKAAREAQIPTGFLHWSEKMQGIKKLVPAKAKLPKGITPNIVLAEIIWATQARMLKENRLPEKRALVPEKEKLCTLPISQKMIEILKQKGFLPKQKKYDFSSKAKVSLADYFEARNAWYKYAFEVFKELPFFKYANPKDRTRLLIAAGKGPEGLREAWKNQKIPDTSELGRYTRSIIEYAKWAE